MAQKREKKDETLELKVPTEAPLSLSSSSTSCPDNCKISGGNPNLDPGRIDPGNCEKAGPSSRRSRSGQKARPEREDPATSASSEQSDVPPAKKAVNRCCGCGKRVGLTGFRCRCGDLFCSEHRYSDRHDCSFDYKAAGREAIARENPVVRAAKILKV